MFAVCMQYTTKHIVMNTVSQNEMHLTLLSIFSMMNLQINIYTYIINS